MGEKEADEMLFWTQDEYERFIEAIKDKPESFYAFLNLYIGVVLEWENY